MSEFTNIWFNSFQSLAGELDLSEDEEEARGVPIRQLIQRDYTTRVSPVYSRSKSGNTVSLDECSTPLNAKGKAMKTTPLARSSNVTPSPPAKRRKHTDKDVLLNVQLNTRLSDSDVVVVSVSSPNQLSYDAYVVATDMVDVLLATWVKGAPSLNVVAWSLES